MTMSIKSILRESIHNILVEDASNLKEIVDQITKMSDPTIKDLQSLCKNNQITGRCIMVKGEPPRFEFGTPDMIYVALLDNKFHITNIKQIK